MSRTSGVQDCAWWAGALVLAISAGVGIGLASGLAACGAIALLAMAAGVWRPAVGLVGVAALCTIEIPLQTFFLADHSLPWNTLNYCFLPIILVYLPFILRLRDAPSVLLKLLIALLILGLFWSDAVRTGAAHVLNAGIQFGILLYFIRTAGDNTAIVWAGIASGAVAAAASAVYFLQASSLQYVNPNALVQTPLAGLFAICLALPAALENRQSTRVLEVLACLNFAWVYLSGSRGGLLTAAPCILFLFCKTPSVGRRALIAAAGITVVLVAMNSYPQLESKTGERLRMLFDPNLSPRARTSGRSDLALLGWQIFRSHPLGIGTGGFSAAAWESGSGAIFAGREMEAHSGWIKTLAENGFPGLLLMVSYVGSFIFIGWQQRTRGMLAIGLLITSTLAIAFLSTEFQNKSLWMLTAGGTVMLARSSSSLRRAVRGSEAHRHWRQLMPATSLSLSHAPESRIDSGHTRPRWRGEAAFLYRHIAREGRRGN